MFIIIILHLYIQLLSINTHDARTVREMFSGVTDKIPRELGNNFGVELIFGPKLFPKKNLINLKKTLTS